MNQQEEEQRKESSGQYTSHRYGQLQTGTSARMNQGSYNTTGLASFCFISPPGHVPETKTSVTGSEQPAPLCDGISTARSATLGLD